MPELDLTGRDAELNGLSASLAGAAAAGPAAVGLAQAIRAMVEATWSAPAGSSAGAWSGAREGDVVTIAGPDLAITASAPGGHVVAARAIGERASVVCDYDGPMRVRVVEGGQVVLDQSFGDGGLARDNLDLGGRIASAEETVHGASIEGDAESGMASGGLDVAAIGRAVTGLAASAAARAARKKAMEKAAAAREAPPVASAPPAAPTSPAPPETAVIPEAPRMPAVPTPPPVPSAPTPPAPGAPAPLPMPPPEAQRWCYVTEPVDMYDLHESSRQAGVMRPGKWYVALRERGGWLHLRDVASGYEAWAPANRVTFSQVPPTAPVPQQIASPPRWRLTPILTGAATIASAFLVWAGRGEASAFDLRAPFLWNSDASTPSLGVLVVALGIAMALAGVVPPLGKVRRLFGVAALVLPFWFFVRVGVELAARDVDPDRAAEILAREMAAPGAWLAAVVGLVILVKPDRRRRRPPVEDRG